MTSIYRIARAVLNIPNLIRMGNTYSQKKRFSTFNPSSPTLYESRKISPWLPSDSVPQPFPTIAGIETGIFRYSCGEILGPNADKMGVYKNPEYFSYHDMSFYDIHYLLRKQRQKQPVSKRKPVTF